jgi:hypothetical protein
MTTTVQPKPIEIVINAVQHTPDRDPVLIQYAGKGVTTGPFASGQCHHTTQTALAARSGMPDYWSDAECKAELAAHLAEHGITAVIVDNVDPPQPAEPVQATRLEAAAGSGGTAGGP